jgi:hypothetical protein
MEVGPYRLQDDHTLKYNEGRWDEFANLLFVDNPDNEVSGHLIQFMEIAIGVCVAEPGTDRVIDEEQVSFG